MPCWMLLITASSALRCSVSFSRRCVSSNRRAFSSATPMLATIVCSSRTSAVSERVLALEALDDDDADDAVGGDDLHRQASTASIRCPPRTPAAATSAAVLRTMTLRSEVTSSQRASDAVNGAIVRRVPCSIS